MDITSCGTRGQRESSTGDTSNQERHSKPVIKDGSSQAIDRMASSATGAPKVIPQSFDSETTSDDLALYGLPPSDFDFQTKGVSQALMHRPAIHTTELPIHHVRQASGTRKNLQRSAKSPEGLEILGVGSHVPGIKRGASRTGEATTSGSAGLTLRAPFSAYNSGAITAFAHLPKNLTTFGTGGSMIGNTSSHGISPAMQTITPAFQLGLQPASRATGVTLTTFTMFPYLPTEIRFKVMGYNLPGRRLMRVEAVDSLPLQIRDLKSTFKSPVNLHVCCEIRMETLRTYKPISRGFGSFGYTDSPVYFNLELDTLDFTSRWMLKYMTQHPSLLELPFKNIDGLKELAMDISGWTYHQIIFILTQSLEIFPLLEGLELYFAAGKYPELPETWEFFCRRIQNVYRKRWTINSLWQKEPNSTLRSLPTTAFQRAPLGPDVTTINEIDVTAEDIISSVPWGGIAESELDNRLVSANWATKVFWGYSVLVENELLWHRVPGTLNQDRVWRCGGKVALVRDVQFEKGSEGGEQNIPALVLDQLEDSDDEDDNDMW